MMNRNSNLDKDALEFDIVIEKILQDFRNSNNDSTVKAYCDTYPHFAVDIRRIFPVLHFLESCKDFSIGLLDSEENTHVSQQFQSVYFDQPINRIFQTPVPFGRYELEKELGRGNMGVVYLANDRVLKRKVALKISTNHEIINRRFHIEAMAMAVIEHPNLCPIFDVGKFGGYSYISMRHIQGKTLEEHLIDSGPLDPKQAFFIIRELAKALSELHKVGLIHRDIKPSNVMIANDGTPFLMDLGLARMHLAMDPKITQAGEIVGSPAYLSPERIEPELGETTTSSDLYSLGVVFFEIISGRRPFHGSPFRVMRDISLKKAPKLSTVSKGVSVETDRLCARLLERKPKNRLSSAEELIYELNHLLNAKISSQRFNKAVMAPVFIVSLFALLWCSVMLSGMNIDKWFQSQPSQVSKSIELKPGIGLISGTVRAVQLGDLDGDGDLDAFAARYDDKLVVMINQGDGHFEIGPPVPDPDNWRNWEVAIGDVDGDGDLDAFVTKNGTDRLWLNTGDGVFWDSQQEFGNGESNQALFADLDDDGDLDLLVTQNVGCTLWLNDEGIFTRSTQQFGQNDFYSCKAGDLDSDGDLDLVLGTAGSLPNQIWINQSNGRFVKSDQKLGHYAAWDLELADLDQDKDLDLLLGNGDGPVEVYLNDGKGQFQFATKSPVATKTLGIRAFDIDQDGDMDIFESNYDKDESDVVWLSENGKFFSKKIMIPTISGERCDIGDLDADGDLDIFGNRAWLNQTEIALIR